MVEVKGDLTTRNITYVFSLCPVCGEENEVQWDEEGAFGYEQISWCKHFVGMRDDMLTMTFEESK